MVQNNKISMTELAKELNVSSRTIERDIAKLKKEKKLERFGTEKGGHWKVIDL